MNSENYVIETQQLQKRFGQKQVLNDVTLQIPRGAVVGLLGTNGCGKSTYIKCLLGLLKITSGSARIFGEDAWDLSAQTKSRIGYVPQVVHSYPWMTVDQMIAYTAAHYPNWDDRHAEQLRLQWDLRGNEKAAALSTGQQQRLGIVLALGHHPELLILDEPAASLDPMGRRQLLSSVLEQVGDSDQTVLFSTHITSDLERVASHVAILKDGKLQCFEALDDLKDRIKRIRILSEKDLPIDLQIPEAFRVEVTGRTAVAAVALKHEQDIAEFGDQWDAQVVVEDLNLEDIFLELQNEQ